jgi:tetratricopeptide (TPR) repeat protein
MEAARKVLQEAANRYPEHARILYWLGSVQLMRQAPAESIEPLQRAVQVAPAFNEAKVKLAQGLVGAGRLEEAETVLLDVVDRNPVNHPDAWNNLGSIYLQMERFDEALPPFERATQLDPDLTTAWANAGAVYLFREELERAEENFERALAVDPFFVPALGNLAMIYQHRQLYPEARDMLQRLLVVNPGDERARVLLEQLDREQGGAR